MCVCVCALLELCSLFPLLILCHTWLIANEAGNWWEQETENVKSQSALDYSPGTHGNGKLNLEWQEIHQKIACNLFWSQILDIEDAFFPSN